MSRSSRRGGLRYSLPSDYTIERMIKEDMLHKLDLSNIPNFKYIADRFKNLDYDPENEYSVHICGNRRYSL